MKIIDYPEAEAVMLTNARGEREPLQLDLAQICERVVFIQAFWRERANVGFALTLMAKLEKRLPITDPEHEALEKGMKLDGQQLSPEINRFYLKCLSAVYSARTDTKEHAA